MIEGNTVYKSEPLLRTLRTARLPASAFSR